MHGCKLSAIGAHQRSHLSRGRLSPPHMTYPYNYIFLSLRTHVVGEAIYGIANPYFI